jgi:hypothetical protein
VVLLGCVIQTAGCTFAAVGSAAWLRIDFLPE